jgi:hypothetical protein
LTNRACSSAAWQLTGITKGMLGSKICCGDRWMGGITRWRYGKY